MNLREDYDYTPSLKLLPFGGFDVASLLHRLHSGQALNNEATDDSLDSQPKAGVVSSGWLSSKIMAG